MFQGLRSGALRTFSASSALILGCAAAALGLVLPIIDLFVYGAGGLESKLRMAPIAGGSLGLPWAGSVRPPAATQHLAVEALSRMLLCTAVATLAVAVVSLIIVAIARDGERGAELAVRRAVGASRRMLLGSALVEGGALAVAALMLGVPAGLALAHVARSAWPGVATPGWALLAGAVTVGVAGVIVLAIAIPVAFPTQPMHAGQSEARTPLALIAVQLGVSLAALTAGAAIADHAERLTALARTQRGEGFVYSVALPETASADRAARYETLLADLGRQQGESVSLASPGMLMGLGSVAMITTDCGLCTENGMSMRWRIKPVTYQFVSADTFRLLQMPMIAGRGIGVSDTWTAPRVAVVSRSLARREFQRGQAVGRQVQTLVGGSQPSTVVGVVDDRRPTALGGALQPVYTVYLSVLQHPPASAELLLRQEKRARPTPSPSALTALLGPSASVSRPTAASELLRRQVEPVRWFGTWFRVEGWTMLALAVIGVAALMALWIQWQLIELGVRRAVGARRRHLLAFVLLRALGVGVGGAIVGLWIGSAVWPALPSVVPGIEVWNAPLVVRLSLLLGGAALLGALVPAWRAARRPPVDLLAGSRMG